jgi:hypothetical protein
VEDVLDGVDNLRAEFVVNGEWKPSALPSFDPRDDDRDMPTVEPPLKVAAVAQQSLDHIR